MVKLTENLNSVVNNFNSEMEKMKKDMSTKFQKELTDVFKGVFLEYPSLKKIAWTQYTPYFNDGDPCVFHYGYMTALDDSIEDNEDLEMHDWMEVGYNDDVKLKYPLLEDISDALSRSEDILLSMFGDHCMVTVTPGGIAVDEYDHD